jgi:hypothetical protein
VPTVVSCGLTHSFLRPALTFAQSPKTSRQGIRQARHLSIALAAIRGNVLLGHSVSDRANYKISILLHEYNDVQFRHKWPSGLCRRREGAFLPRESPYKIVLTKQERDEGARISIRYRILLSLAPR